MKKAYVSVINDLVTDQRVHKSCVALQKSGYEVILIGRKLRDSLPVSSRPYRTVRMRLIFTKGSLFYAEFNIRLFLYLFFHSCNLLLSNDLDTILPNYFISRFRKIPLIYDSHEYFTETPELINRKLVQGIWKQIEKFVLSRLNKMITVNESIALLFRQQYGIDVTVVRNIPPTLESQLNKTKDDLGLPNDKQIIILQGSGINIDRGAEELVLAMQFLQNTLLVLIGGGDAMPVIRNIISDKQLESSVLLLPKMNYPEMMEITRLADLGFTIDKDTNLNYRFSLPNKLFDYIHAGIPVIASPLVEIKSIIDAFQIGGYIESHDPQSIAMTIQGFFDQPDLIEKWRFNLKFAAQSLCWENEEKILLAYFKSIS